MALWKNFKIFFAKEYYDFNKPDITLHNFHPQLRIFLSLDGIFFNNPDSRLRLITPVISIMFTLVGTAFEIMCIWHGLEINDYALATECFVYLLALGTIPLVFMSILLSRDKITQILHNMDGHFAHVCNLGLMHKQKFMEGQLMVWKLGILWFIFTFSTCCCYVMNTVCLLVYQSLFDIQDEYTRRELIFPLWLPYDDPYRTPNYEVFLVVQILLIYIILQSFGAYIYILFHFLLHHYNVLELILMDFETLFDGVEAPTTSTVRFSRDHPGGDHVQRTLSARIERIVDWHNDVFDAVAIVSTVFGPPLVYQVLLSSVAICLIAYQIVDQLEKGKFDFLFAILGAAAGMQLWIPCYLGTLLRNKALSVGDACWNCGWEKTPLSRYILMDIVIVILRSQRPVTIKFTALPNLTLETFSSIMSSSYSYFNMLRQSTKN